MRFNRKSCRLGYQVADRSGAQDWRRLGSEVLAGFNHRLDSLFTRRVLAQTSSRVGVDPAFQDITVVKQSFWDVNASFGSG
jgi:hypothetical protein